ncbi:endospore germination permease [Bacillus sp. SD075]|uniref:GerAB/ArcD/ProY family transporter n=1 Tax=Bacillus sp. SD075 TaxID=2781732 RepID=UPI001A972A00|nr:endospore germination permease [Bacillus sp. SD075]MBO0999656.1 endospore germination permease [Bacillus sp. SD075]
MLTKWETFFLLAMTLPIMGHIVILPLMLDVAGRDAWISIFISLPVAFMFAIAIYRLRLKYPKQNISDMLHNLLGKPFGTLIMMVFIIYFLFLTVFSFALLVDFVYIAFLPETPRLAILVWFLIFFVYASIKGIKRIALTAGILAMIALVTGHTITLLDTRMKDWSQLQPIFEFGWSPTLWGALLLVSIWIELLLLLCVPIQNIREKRMFLLWSMGILLNALMMFSTTTGSIAIFGLGQADNFVYPSLESVRIISLGFIDRFDIYGLILMAVGSYIRCSLYFRISYDITVSKVSSKWIRRFWFTGFVLLVFLGTNYLSKEHFRLEKMLNIYAYMVILLPIPFLLLGRSYLKEKTRQS